MPKTRPPYALEFRRQLVELVRARRDPADLSREFEPSAQAIRNWVMQADLAEGRREKPASATATEGGLPTAEREELARLRREVRQLRLERDILSKAAAWFPSAGIPPADPGGTLTSFAQETGTLPSGSSGS